MLYFLFNNFKHIMDACGRNQHMILFLSLIQPGVRPIPNSNQHNIQHNTKGF